MRATRNFATLVMAGLFSCASATAQRPSDGPLTGPPAAPTTATPKWGLSDLELHSLYAWDFHPLDDRMIFGDVTPGAFRKYCVSSTAPYTSCYLEAPVHLPNGVHVSTIQLGVCDSSTGDAKAGFYSVSSVDGASVLLGYIDSTFLNGCHFYAGAIDHTIDNYNNAYAVEVNLPIGDANISLRKVLLSYQLQASPPPAVARFNDVPSNHPFFQYIEALAASGITAGCGPDTFCPNSPVTRGQMAVFLVKALGLYWPTTFQAP